MGKRKPRSSISTQMLEKKSRSAICETLVSCKGRRREEDDGTVRKEGKNGFFACYLLISLSPSHKGRTYIGFTVNPRRRIRQHNGEIGSGAYRTKSRRPWEMVFCIYGFPTNVSALQFEWAWQHPRESLAVRDAAATFKSLTGLANKIRLGFKMLTLPAWEKMNLTVNFFSTKYTKHSAGCPSLPEHMKVQVCSMDELPCYTRTGPNTVFEDEDDCEDGNCENTSTEYGLASEASPVAEFDNQKGGGIKEDIGTLFIATSPLQESSTFTTSASEVNGTREVVAPIEANNNGVEFDPFSRAVDYNEPSILTKVFSCDVEVIDLLSPSPDVRIRFSSKTREVSDTGPKTIIDLTKSPIWV